MKHLPRGILLGFFLLVLCTPKDVYAEVTCTTASTDTASVPPNSNNSIGFSVTNGGPGTVNWIKLSLPSSNFSFADVWSTPDGWSGAKGGSDFTVTGGTLASGNAYGFSIQVTSANTTAESANWTMQISDDGGSATAACSGSLGTAIAGSVSVPDPEISDITVSDISDTQAKISWTTDISATTTVDYGTTDGYGSSISGDAGTSHSVSIGSLSANTTYHYNVKSGNSESGDNTFTTAKQGTTVTTTVTGAVSTTTTIIRATPTPVPDTTGPYVVINTKVDKPFTTAPAIKGTATDRSFVASLEYSVDDGHNWLPVDFIDKPNTARTDFVFTPQLLDGNYIVKVKATDGKGNVSKTDVGTLIVDRLPPRIGGVVISLGPQELPPTGNGVYIMTSGLDYKITLSAVGGPIIMDITYVDSDGTTKKTNVTKNPDTGLWTGTLHFNTPGTFPVMVYSKDGADNTIQKELLTVSVLSGGKVLDGTVPITKGKLTVYYLDDSTKQFNVWNAQAYGQVNPQPLSEDGGYRLYLPSGTYYLRITAPGYKTVVSSIFTTVHPYPIVSQFSLVRARALQIGPWLIPIPDFRQVTTTIDVHSLAVESRVLHAIVNQEFPYFKFASGTDFVTVNTLRGKPTIITFVNTWLPQAAAQLAVLGELAKKSEINVLVVIPQETVSSVSIYKKRAGYTFPIVADPDGDLIETLSLHVLPAHIIVNRKGIVQSVQTGLYDKQQFLDMIIQ